MQRIARYNLLFLLGLWILLSCGGGKHIPAKNPIPLGVVPFATDAMTRESTELNRKLLRSLHSSGRFQVIRLQQRAQLLNMEDFAALSPSSPEAIPFDTLMLPETATDSLLNAHAGLPRWILTGVFIREQEFTSKGSLVPLVLFAPSRRLLAELEYRLYDSEENRWIDIQRLITIKKKRGNWQLVDFDPHDPSLAVLASERQQWRDELYSKLFDDLVKSVEGLTNDSH